MTHFRFFCIILTTVISLSAQSKDSLDPSFSKALIVYDKLDTVTTLYVSALRNQLQKKGVLFDEMAVEEKKGKSSIEGYQTLCIYSRVMAFTMKSPVIEWISSLPSLHDYKVYIFVTANRWLYDTHLKQVVKAVKDKNGTVIDAVTEATKDLSKEQKIKSATDFADRIAR
jgi:hypothetical protein